MVGITLADAEAQLAIWIAASTAVARNQSYTVKDRSLTRANAKEIRENIAFWNDWVLRLSRVGKARTRYVVPE